MRWHSSQWRKKACWSWQYRRHEFLPWIVLCCVHDSWLSRCLDHFVWRWHWSSVFSVVDLFCSLRLNLLATVALLPNCHCCTATADTCWRSVRCEEFVQSIQFPEYMAEMSQFIVYRYKRWHLLKKTHLFCRGPIVRILQRRSGWRPYLVPGSSRVKDALGDTIPSATPVLRSLFNLFSADAYFPEIFLDDIFPVLSWSTWPPPETLGFPCESLSRKSMVIHSWKMSKASQTSASDVPTG